MMNWQLVISCEHASNEVPTFYQHLFTNAEQELKSHKGWDPGSLEIAERLGKTFDTAPFVYPYTRLLIEPNRSMEHPQLFSVYSAGLPPQEKMLLIEEYYLPHRNTVEDRISELVSRGPVLHLGIHTFTPVWDGKERKVDIGILYDPGRKMESHFCERFIEVLQKNARDLSIRPNEPYLGIDDGFTTYLRTRFRDEEYLGIEIEVSQRFPDSLPAMSDLLGRSLKEAMQGGWDRSV